MKVKVTVESGSKPDTFWVTEEQAQALTSVLEVFQGLESDDSFEVTGVTRVYAENVSLAAERNKTSCVKDQ